MMARSSAYRHIGAPKANQYDTHKKELPSQQQKQRAKNRTLMYPNSYFRPLTETAVYPYSWVCTIVHNFHWPNNPFINSQLPHSPPKDGTRYLVKGLFQVNKNEVDFLLPNKVFLLHLSENVCCICSTAPRHKTKLHVTNVNLGANKTFKNMLENFHHMIQELKSPIVPTICCITFFN